MNDAALEGKQRFRRTAVIFVLLDRVLVVLLGQVVFQFHRDDGKAVQKYADVKGEERIEFGILNLPRNAENVLFIQRRRIGILGRRTHIKQIQLQMLIPHTFSEQLDHAVGL